MPIGSNATYAAVPSITSLPLGINTKQWTTSVGIATAANPVANVLITHASWTFLTTQGGLNCHNDAAHEATLRGESSTYTASTLTSQMNTWSTINPDSTIYTQPATYLPASSTFQQQFYTAPGICPSPDTDGLYAVIQPDGFSMEWYGAVVLANGDTVGNVVVTRIDLKNGDGTGYWNGRRASMIPAIAGVIRSGEMGSCLIPHALIVNVPPSVLTNQAVWPAYAFDRNSGYSGTLPMGTLLAIPPSVDITKLGLSTQGKVLATALQNFGAYIADRGGGGVAIYAELNVTDLSWGQQNADLAILIKQLQRVTNNGANNVGGGGTPRASLAPPFAN